MLVIYLDLINKFNKTVDSEWVISRHTQLSTAMKELRVLQTEENRGALKPRYYLMDEETKEIIG